LQILKNAELKFSVTLIKCTTWTYSCSEIMQMRLFTTPYPLFQLLLQFFCLQGRKKGDMQ